MPGRFCVGDAARHSDTESQYFDVGRFSCCSKVPVESFLKGSPVDSRTDAHTAGGEWILLPVRAQAEKSSPPAPSLHLGALALDFYPGEPSRRLMLNQVS